MKVAVCPFCFFPIQLSVRAGHSIATLGYVGIPYTPSSRIAGLGAYSPLKIYGAEIHSGISTKDHSSHSMPVLSGKTGCQPPL